MSERNLDPVLLNLLQQTPLEELGPAFKILADRLHEHREKNNGYTPPEIFLSALEIGTSYACLGLALLVKDVAGTIIGAMLKCRSKAEQDWAGQKAIPDFALMPFETLAQAQVRLTALVTDDPELRVLLLNHIMEAWTLTEVHREDPERRVNCLTGVYAITVTDDMRAKLKEEFTFVPLEQFNDESIVAHHRPVLARLVKLQNG